jgi:hypothetical protein
MGIDRAARGAADVTTTRRIRDLRRRCRRLIQELIANTTEPLNAHGRAAQQHQRAVHVEEPVTVSREMTLLCTAVAKRTQHNFYVHPMPKRSPRGPTGLWIATRSAHHVFVQAGLPDTLINHTIAHEFGHIVLGHNGTPDVAAISADLDLLDRAMVRRTLGLARARDLTALDDAEEEEAETFAFAATIWASSVARRAKASSA